MTNCYKDKKEYVLSLKDAIALLVHCDLLNHDYQMTQFSSDTHDVLINQTTKNLFYKSIKGSFLFVEVQFTTQKSQLLEGRDAVSSAHLISISLVVS